ncbi:MAG: Beta-barrel assembly-enhancing protease [Prosthecobacter sp.]|jgi:predicted Zn-dependent protease|nr:Beta-barrel assembly-enhancing protease [Prosthecobacter sp.]
MTCSCAAAFSASMPALILTLVVACTTNPDTRRTSFNAMPVAEEREMGKFLHTMVTAQMKVVHDDGRAGRVQRVGRRLTQGLRAPHAEWRFLVVEGTEFNAFTLPGGTIGVYTGLLDKLEGDDLLAAVMGHEVAHAMLRHPTEKLGGSYVGARIGEMISSPLAVVLSPEQKKLMHYKNLFRTMSITDLLDRPINQKRELEADAEGMRLMARAGYDPKAAIALWGVMSDLERRYGRGVASFLSSHPGGTRRLEFLAIRLPEAERLYQASKR